MKPSPGRRSPGWTSCRPSLSAAGTSGDRLPDRRLLQRESRCISAMYRLFSYLSAAVCSRQRVVGGSGLLSCSYSPRLIFFETISASANTAATIVMIPNVSIMLSFLLLCRTPLACGYYLNCLKNSLQRYCCLGELPRRRAPFCRDTAVYLM